MATGKYNILDAIGLDRLALDPLLFTYAGGYTALYLFGVGSAGNYWTFIPALRSWAFSLLRA